MVNGMAPIFLSSRQKHRLDQKRITTGGLLRRGMLGIARQKHRLDQKRITTIPSVFFLILN